jgi:hypothetical protein
MNKSAVALYYEACERLDEAKQGNRPIEEINTLLDEVRTLCDKAMAEIERERNEIARVPDNLLTTMAVCLS